MRSTSSAPTSAAIQRARCWKCSIRARTTLCRSLSRRAIRSVASHLHRDRELHRRNSGAIARSNGDDRSAGLHRARETRDRKTIPLAAPTKRKRIEAGAGEIGRGSAAAKLSPNYTHEAGVRELERQIGAVCRAVAARVARGTTEHVQVTPAFVKETLGPAALRA